MAAELHRALGGAPIVLSGADVSRVGTSEAQAGSEPNEGGLIL